MIHITVKIHEHEVDTTVKYVEENGDYVAISRSGIGVPKMMIDKMPSFDVLRTFVCLEDYRTSQLEGFNGQFTLLMVYFEDELHVTEARYITHGSVRDLTLAFANPDLGRKILVNFVETLALKNVEKLNMILHTLAKTA